MIKILIQNFFYTMIILVGTLVQAQYSHYYNLNANIHEFKTIATIDYGALKLANVQAEKNRFEHQKYIDSRDRQISLEISQEPVKAYEYGSLFSTALTRNIKNNAAMVKILKKRGFKKAIITFKTPSEILFSTLSSSHQPFLSFQNVSIDNVKTDFHMDLPTANSMDIKFNFEKSFDKIKIGEEVEDIDFSNISKKQLIIYHKKELNRATVFGEKGYRETVSWENKFEYGISDRYLYNDEIAGYFVIIETRYYGNKSEIDFEKLEGRRYYLRPLIEKIISNGTIQGVKLY